MPTSDHAAAWRDLDRFTAAFTKAKVEFEETRPPLQAAIVRHLMERNARPGDIADHSPYDRNHVGLLGREHGVPPLKGRNATGPAPVYKPETEAAALAELDGLTAAYTRAEDNWKKKRDALHAAISRHYDAGAPPGELAAHTPYDRNHVHRIAKAAREGAR